MTLITNQLNFVYNKKSELYKVFLQLYHIDYGSLNFCESCKNMTCKTCNSDNTNEFHFSFYTHMNILLVFLVMSERGGKLIDIKIMLKYYPRFPNIKHYYYSDFNISIFFDKFLFIFKIR